MNKHNIKKFINDDNGIAYIEAIIATLLIASFISLLISLIPIPFYKIRQESLGNQLIKTSEIEGYSTSHKVKKRASELEKKYRLNNLTISGTTSRAPLNENVDLIITSHYQFKIFFTNYELPVVTKITGTSQCYSK